MYPKRRTEKRARYVWRARKIDFGGKNQVKLLLKGGKESQPSRPGRIGIYT